MRQTSAGRAVVVVALVFAGRSTSAQVRIEPLPPAVPTHTGTPAAPLTHWADRLGYRSAAPRSAPPEPDGSVRCSVAVVLPDSLALVGGPGGIGPVDLWDANRGQWATLVPAPTATDTLRTRVVGADCGALPLRIWVKTGIDYLAVYDAGIFAPAGIHVIGLRGELSPAKLTTSGANGEMRVEAMTAADLIARNAHVPTPAESRDAAISRLPFSGRELVRTHQVRVGMTDDEARMSWGDPDHVNTTIVSGRTLEPWVYSVNRYLYIENGFVAAIQY